MHMDFWNRGLLYMRLNVHWLPKFTIKSLVILPFLFMNCKGNSSVAPQLEAYLNGIRLDETYSIQLGNILQNSPAQTYPLVLRNTGAEKLVLTGGNILVNTNSAYALTGLSFPIELSPKAEVAGTLTVNPVTGGNLHFSMALTTDNSLLPTFNVNCMLTVTTVPMPEIAVLQGVTNYTNNGFAYSFGSVLTGSSNAVTFTVYNLGTANLNIGGTPSARLLGANAAEFSVTSFPATTVAPLATTTLTLQLNAATAGTKTAYAEITNNDSDETIFVINLSAVAQNASPEINLTQGGPNYLSGSTYSYSSAIAGGTYDTVFTIQNLGTGPLALSGAPLVSITGANAADFSLQASPASIVAAAGTTSFAIRFRPTNAVTKNATLTISNNDSNEASYQVFLTANVTAPEIGVRAEFNGTFVAATSGNAIDLGFTDTGDGDSRLFRIENTGNQTLHLTGNPTVQFTGTHAADFSIVTPPSSYIDPGNASYFTVLVKPSAIGTRTAIMTISNNDYDEGAFVIPLTMSGSSFVQKAPLANYWKTRSGAKTVVFDNKIFLFSGYPNEVWSSSSGLTWTCRNSAPGWGLKLEAAVVHQGKILVFDGEKIWQSFDGINYSIAAGATPWSGRTGMGVVSFGGKLYLFGGYSSWVPAYYNDVWSSSDGITWAKISNSAPWSARTGIHAAVHNGKIFMIGGSSTRDVWTTSDGIAWTQVSNNAIPVRNNAAVVSFGTKLYLYGGLDNSSVSYADVYSTTTGASFTLETSLPGFSPRASHTALEFAGKVILMTGYSAGGNQRDVYEAADGINFTQLDANADIFEPRWGHKVVNLNGKLILTGGKDVLNNHKNDSWTSTDGMVWRLANGNAPWSARRGHSFTVHGSAVYLIGGGTAASSGNVNREIWRTIDGINYTLLTSNPAFPARFHHTAISFGGKLWIFGGVGGAGAQFNDAWHSADGVNWTQAPNIPKAIEGATLTAHAGELYLAAGYCGSCTPQFSKSVYKSADGLIWTEVPVGSTYGTVGQIGVSYADKFWLLGGSGSAQGALLVSGTIQHLTWNSPVGMRDNAGYTLFNDGSGEKLWVFGGAVSGNGILNDIMTMEALP